MNKKEFLRELRKKLKSLPENEKADAISYYEEYFEDAQMDDNTDVLCELSSPSEIASQILSQYAVKELNSSTKPIKKGISSIWFILLAVIVSPIAFPIALPILILIVVSVFLVFVLGFVVIVVSMSLVGAGISIFISGFSYIFNDLGMTFMSLGIGSIIIGISVLVFMGLIMIASKLFKAVVKISNKRLNDINSKNN